MLFRPLRDVPYEMSCFLVLMRFHEDFLMRFHAYLVHNFLMRLPYEISCFYAVVRFAYEIAA